MTRPAALSRRGFLASLAACALPAGSRAQGSYPQRPVRIIVPYAPGGIADTLARLVGERLTERLGQPFIIENRAGGGTIIGTRAVVDSDPDGHTLLLGTTVLSINPALLSNIPYDVARDLAPVVQVGNTATVVAVHPDLPVRSLRELVELEKSKPGTMSYGTAGQGSVPHIAGEYLNQVAGTRFMHVPHRGSAPALTSAVAGHIPVVVDVLNSILPFLQDGKLRPLAVLDPQRTPLLPDVPTAIEAGYPNFVTQAYYGLLAPRRTPPEIVQRLARETTEAITRKDFVERAAGQGITVIGGTPDDFARMIERETAAYGTMIRSAGIKGAS